jgi:ABC-2 type transport system permease protein
MIFASARRRWKICICPLLIKKKSKSKTTQRTQSNKTCSHAFLYVLNFADFVHDLCVALLLRIFMRHQSFLVQLFDLFLIQLTNWRWSWRSMIIMGIFTPLFSIGAFSAFANQDPHAAGYILTGNLVLALLLDGLNKVSSNFSYMRMAGTLDYFASLPLYRPALIIATVGAFLLLSMPAVIITLILGQAILHIPLAISPLIVLVVPLISVSLCGLGALIGVMGRTPEEVNSLNLLTTFGLFGFGPILIPLDRLPPVMHTLSLLSPATYAASALRQVVLGIPDRIPLFVDMLVLAIVAAGLLWFVTQRLDWRGRG